MKKMLFLFICLLIVFTQNSYALESSQIFSDVKVEEVGAGKYKIEMNINSDIVSKVKYPTWSDKNGQDDIIWYDATIENDKAFVTIDFKNHNYNTGKYITDVYIYDKSGNKYYGGSYVKNIKNSAPKISDIKIVNKSAGKYIITASIYDDYGIDKVMFPTWTEKNGQDDIKWYNGKIINDTVEVCIDFKNHGYEIGKYITDVYVYDKAGLKTYGGSFNTSITNNPPIVNNVNIQNSKAGKYSISANISDDYQIDKVLFPTWSDAHGQNDIKWYEADIVGNIATAQIDFKNHDYDVGKYITDVYVYDKAGFRSYGGSYKTEVKNGLPGVSNIKTETLGAGRYKISATVTDDYGIEKVLFPTWTENKGQDDIVWHKATVKGNTAEAIIDFKYHNYDAGTYITDVYVYDKAGLKIYGGSYKNTIKNNPPTVSKVNTERVGAGKYKIIASINDDYCVSRVVFPTWSSSKGQDDIVWYEGKIKGNTAEAIIDFKNHDYDVGQYVTDVYVYDKAGLKVYGGSYNMTITNDNPTITKVTITNVTANGYTVNCYVNDDYEADYVTFPTWTEFKGQDDIVWGKSKVVNGVATYRVNISDHDYNYGKYITHLYAYDKAGKSDFAATSQTINAPKSSAGWKILNNRKYLYDTNQKIVEGGKYFVIDVSKWQGTVDWNKVAKESMVDAVILRISHGRTGSKDGMDSKVKSYVSQLNRLNIPYGFYHYNTAKDNTEALKQAQNAIKYIKDIKGKPSLPVYVDIEEGGNDRNQTSIAKTYCQYFQSKGYRAGVYANKNYWDNYLNKNQLKQYDLWIANYGTNNGLPRSNWRPSEDYTIWQYTSVGKIPGIKGNVDLNVMFE